MIEVVTTIQKERKCFIMKVKMTIIVTKINVMRSNSIYKMKMKKILNHLIFYGMSWALMKKTSDLK